MYNGTLSGHKKPGMDFGGTVLSEVGQSGRQTPMISLTCGILLKPNHRSQKKRPGLYIRTEGGGGNWKEVSERHTFLADTVHTL